MFLWIYKIMLYVNLVKNGILCFIFFKKRDFFYSLNVRRVATWPALENVTERSDMTRFLQMQDMCPIGLYVTRLLIAFRALFSKN